MSMKWIGDVAATMRLEHIKVVELAAEAGYCTQYVSMILNGRRFPKNKEAQAVILAALDRLTGKGNPTVRRRVYAKRKANHLIGEH